MADSASNIKLKIGMETLHYEMIACFERLQAVEKGLLSIDEGVIKLEKLKSIGRYSKQILDDTARLSREGKVWLQKH